MRSIPLAFLSLALASPAAAVEILYPQDTCATIVGTDLSTPGGDSSNYVFEMLCKDNAGNHVVLVTTWSTTGAFLGFGRATAPERITLTPSQVDGLVVDE